MTDRYVYLASKKFEIQRNDFPYMKQSPEPIWFKVMPFQQVAWYFRDSGCYIIVSETYWNMLLYYITGPGKTKNFFKFTHQIIPSTNQMNVEVYTDSTKIKEFSSDLNNISLLCFLFLHNELNSSNNKVDVVMKNDNTNGTGMQTTLEWHGLYMNLMKSEVEKTNKHVFIDPYDESTVEKRGYISIYSDDICAEPNSVIIVENDNKLKKWKEHNINSHIISSKRRTGIKPSEINGQPIGCHFSKAGILYENGFFFDCVYITQQCFESVKSLPRSKRYVLCVDENTTVNQINTDPKKLRLFGISEDVISSVTRDETGILFYFLIASCLSPKLQKKQEKRKIVSSFRSV